jgi:hypothetical protein
MNTVLKAAALLGALMLPLQAQDPNKGACEVRAYLLGKDRKPVSPNGVSASLVFEDRDGNEKTVMPMTVVSNKEEREKAPNCVLHTRVVEGTSYVAALCGVATDGRLKGKDEAYRADHGGPRFDRDWDRGDSPDDREAVSEKIDFEVPYFRAVVPSDHVCAPECRIAVRFMIKGEYHSTRTFPCPAGK